MPPFQLRFAAPATVSHDEAKSSFYWLSGGQSSFTTGLGPNLGTLGPVPALSIDLVRIAITVYAADRSVYRTARGSDWNQRNIELVIPVSDSSAWGSVASDLEGVVAFLTGDRWTLSFNEDPAPSETIAVKTTASKRVVLLSGGADSAIGALLSRADLADDEEHTLLSHFSASTVAPIQRRIVERVEGLIPGPQQQHLQIHLSRNQRRLDGTNYASESSSRSRSLLFLALGLAVAAVDGVPLWIPENGFASLNPPLGPERRGSLSTRTTHPAFLEGLSLVLAQIGVHGVIENPFADRTKGEMFARATDIIGADDAATLLSASNSCAHTGQRAFGISPAVACGVCFGCVVRRASFHASGLSDTTTYITAGSNHRLQAWLDSISVEAATRSFVARGVHQRDLIAMSLPTSYPVAQAVDLCRRGTAELAGLLA